MHCLAIPQSLNAASAYITYSHSCSLSDTIDIGCLWSWLPSGVIYDHKWSADSYNDIVAFQLGTPALRLLLYFQKTSWNKYSQNYCDWCILLWTSRFLVTASCKAICNLRKYLMKIRSEMHSPMIVAHCLAKNCLQHWTLIIPIQRFWNCFYFFETFPFLRDVFLGISKRYFLQNTLDKCSGRWSPFVDKLKHFVIESWEL